MREYTCPNCGRTVKHTKFPCKGSYACNVACMMSQSKISAPKNAPTVQKITATNEKITYEEALKDVKRKLNRVKKTEETEKNSDKV